MGLLDGLEEFGLGKLTEIDLYDQPNKEQKDKDDAAAKKMVKKVLESDFLFDKSHTCPVCDEEFKEKTVKNGKARLISSDLDLRPKHEGIDMVKYDVISCPKCGYTALSRYFKYVSSIQGKKIKEVISKSFKGNPTEGETYTYDQALERYKLALANAIVKQAKPSEKAYICLKAGWLVRGQMDSLEEKGQLNEDKKATLVEQEKEYLKNALEGFLAARQQETYPMCGMDESTVDYLIAVLAMEFGQYDISTKLIASIFSMTGVNPRMKAKARDLKDILMQRIKEQKN